MFKRDLSHAHTTLVAWVRRGCTRFQIPCLLCLKEKSFPPTIGHAGRRLPHMKHWNLYQLFEFRNYPDAYHHFVVKNALAWLAF